MGTNCAKDDLVLRVITFCSTTSFRGEVKPSDQCHKILQYVNPISKKEVLWRRKSSAISCPVSPTLLLDISGVNCQRALTDESGTIINQKGTTVDQKWSQCKGHLAHPPHTDKV
jgi:hypothetical protein